jgi:hypothetical protein
MGVSAIEPPFPGSGGVLYRKGVTLDYARRHFCRSKCLHEQVHEACRGHGLQTWQSLICSGAYVAAMNMP